MYFRLLHSLGWKVIRDGSMVVCLFGINGKEVSCMKQVTMMYLKNCPHCRRAFALVEELKQEEPAFAAIDIRCIEEQEHPELAAGYDYWYVPTYFVGKEKWLEGVPSKEALRKVLQAAMD